MKMSSLSSFSSSSCILFSVVSPSLALNWVVTMQLSL
jgi:hypothetical protein